MALRAMRRLTPSFGLPINRLRRRLSTEKHLRDAAPRVRPKLAPALLQASSKFRGKHRHLRHECRPVHVNIAQPLVR